ncbi:helix-turn-helix domain-containing protein [Sulfitobacter sp. R18_1]|uniref:helix-turn-helix domain-containing protein n=1 Tax=Sulfitobacter sp. R18_1 TaxID=2821104 RepID=UPI001ADC30C2|nr:helix-turn-helix domain-containing protein [Sulfitobacter sp. R18_1]MBO9428440.1 helix-turn-helix domain-containing protein [Sulfitobacter sp. R18_1]
MPEQTNKKPNGIQIPYDIICDITGNQLRVLMGLRNYTDKDGWCHPSQETLEEELNLSHGTISTCVAALHKKGHITVYPQYDKKTNKRGNNLYQVHVGACYVAPYDKSDAKKSGEATSKNYESRIQKLDGKKQPNNYTQRVKEIYDWEPSEETVRTIIETLGEQKALKLIERFKKRCSEKGYNYANFDEGLLAWSKDELEKTRRADEKKLQRAKAPTSASSQNKAAENAPLHVPEDIQQVVYSLEPNVSTMEPQQRFMASLYWVATQAAAAVKDASHAKSMFDIWLSKLELKADGGAYSVRSKSAYAANYLMGKYADLLREAGRKFDIPLGSFT